MATENETTLTTSKTDNEVPLEELAAIAGGVAEPDPNIFPASRLCEKLSGLARSACFEGVSFLI
jgi:hypothetical protein